MLSRQASALYWIGRYQERTEYLARFLQVKYFSVMDVSTMDFREFTMKSILFMSKGQAHVDALPGDSQILNQVALDPDTPTSIFNYISQVRENTKGVRNIISNELWENINKTYHFVNGFSSEYLATRGLYEFTREVQENIATFHAKLESTLIHDEVWAFIKLGVNLERAFQVNRILINTLIDINSLKGENENEAIENYQWITTLSILEATDMIRKIFKKTLKQGNASEFLITNLDFPRSLAFALNDVNVLIRRIKKVSDLKHLERCSVEFKSARLASELKYLDFKEIEGDLNGFLNQKMTDIQMLNEAINEDFFQK